MLALTRPYQVPRGVLARLALEEYVLRLWWIAAIIPASGLLGLAFGGPYLRAVSLFALLWPLTLPARAFLTTRRAGRLFSAAVTLYAEGDSLLLAGTGPGWKFGKASMVAIAHRHGYAILRLKGLGFVPVEEAAVLEAARWLHGFG